MRFFIWYKLELSQVANLRQLGYNNVSFSSADPNANQTNTSVIKTVTNGGQTTNVYQPVGDASGSGDAVLLDEVQVDN